jgi:cytoskeletal protein CcmA (bactofilin family)
MFSDKKEKNMTEPGTNQNRINAGTTLKGDITSEGFFRIDGVIEGNVNTPSKVVIGKSGSIQGTLTCKDADIEGKFNGKLDVSGTLSLKSTANIEGEAEVGKLAVEPGALFNASCSMKGAAKKKVEVETENKAHPFDRSQRIQKTKTEQQN